MGTGLEVRALEFSRMAHEAVGQFRKYTNEPYIVHPVAVAELVREYGGSSEEIAAAYLHDVHEDAGVPMWELVERFGNEVAQMVYDVTNISAGVSPRARKVAMDVWHFSQGSAGAQNIKLADVIDNTKNVVDLDPKFAAHYLREKLELVEHLTLGNPALRERAQLQLIAELARIS